MTLTFSSSSSARCWPGRQLVVGDEHAEAGLAFGARQLLGLALADVPVRVDVAAVLPLGADDLGARGRGEVGELGERVLGGPALVVPRVDGDEERLLDGRGQFDHVGHPAGGYRGRAPWAVDGQRTIGRWISRSVRWNRPTGRPSTPCSRPRRRRRPWRCRPATGTTSSHRSLPSIQACTAWSPPHPVSKGSWEWRPRTSTRSRWRIGSSPVRISRTSRCAMTYGARDWVASSPSGASPRRGGGSRARASSSPASKRRTPGRSRPRASGRGRSWGPLRIAIVPTTRKASSVRGYRIRAIDGDDVEAVVAGSNAFNADANLYPRLTGDRLQRAPRAHGSGRPGSPVPGRRDARRRHRRRRRGACSGSS